MHHPGGPHQPGHATGAASVLHQAGAKRPRYASSNRRANGEWQRFNLDMMGDLWTLHRTDIVAEACTHAIVSKLLSGGIVYATKAYDRIPSDEFVSHVTRHFVPFCTAVINAILVQGFCPWIIDDDGVPRVIPFGCADLRYRIAPENYKMELAVFDDDGNLQENVLWTIRSHPDSFGRINSPAATYYSTRTFKDTMWRNVMVADYLRARPPLFVSTSTTAAFDDRELNAVGEVDGLRASLTRDNVLVRNRITMDAAAQQDQLVRTLNKMRADTSTPGWRALVDPQSGLENADRLLNEASDYQPVVPLANDAKAVPSTVAQSRHDIVPLNEQLMLLACVAYGVNGEAIGLIHHGGVQSAESISRSNAVLDTTVKTFRQILSQTLVDLYFLMWGGEKEKESDITVLFPSLLDLTQLEKLYKTGLVKHEAFREFISETLSISLKSLEEKAPIDAEQRALADAGVRDWVDNPLLTKKPVDPNQRPEAPGRK